MIRPLLVLVTLSLPLCGAPKAPETPDQIAKQIIAPLINPVKVATLKGDRPANPRLYKVLYWLETARRAGGEPATVIDTAQATAGYTGTPGARADKLAITWNRTKLEEFGCFTPEGMAKLRRGGSPAITKGEHAGDSIEIDHVLPVSVVPELAARFFNLEAISAKTNQEKSASVGGRELDLARQRFREGLLSAAGLAAVETAVARITESVVK